MRYYKKIGNEAKQDIEGHHYWIAIVDFSAGSTVKMDDGQDVPITGNWVLRPSTQLGIIHPWKYIKTTGSVTLLIGENHEPAPPSAGSLLPRTPGKFLT